jgi:hypothetical protein
LQQNKSGFSSLPKTATLRELCTWTLVVFYTLLELIRFSVRLLSYPTM